MRILFSVWLASKYLARNLVTNKKPDPQIAPQAGSMTHIINSCTV